MFHFHLNLYKFEDGLLDNDINNSIYFQGNRLKSRGLLEGKLFESRGGGGRKGLRGRGGWRGEEGEGREGKTLEEGVRER